MDFEVMNATGNDIESLVNIYSAPHLFHNRKEAEWFVKSFFDYHHIKLLKIEGKILGVLFWNVVEEKHHGITEIVDLWIDEAFRRKGLGENLLRSTIKDMRIFFEQDHHLLRKVMVKTGEDNTPARKLYEKVGFERTAVLPDLFAKSENELVYILTLNP